MSCEHYVAETAHITSRFCLTALSPHHACRFWDNCEVWGNLSGPSTYTSEEDEVAALTVADRVSALMF